MSAELTHHGIPGQKWGVRNGPPYPLDSGARSEKRVKKDADKKKIVSNLLDELNTKWQYGVLYKGKHVFDTASFDFEKNYRTTPVEVLEKEKCGVCWDFVNYQHWKLKSAGIDDKAYMFVAERPDGSTITHTFSTYELGGKNYWLESAMWPKRGNHEIKGFKDVIPEMVDFYDLKDSPYSVFEYNPDGLDKGLTDVEYFDKATQNLVLDSPRKSELKHHGIPGQKWGVRNAEWYPIAEYQKSQARSIHETAKKAEPRLTSDVSSAVSRTSAKMYGLDHRLKTEDSIARKYGLGKAIKDAVRYTAVSSEDDFVKNYKAIKADLESKGYKETRCKNYFEDYKTGKVKHKSVQSNYESPDGYEFELQFQTPSSQRAKDLKVPLYEEVRNPKTSSERKEELIRQMEVLADKVKDPKDIDKILSHSLSLKEVLDMELEHNSYGLLYGEYLSHHGVPGQKWGVRNAEWYPIAAWEAAQKGAGKVKAAAKGAADAIKKKRKEFKRAQSLKKARRTKLQNKQAEEKAKASAEERERVLAKGSIGELLKYTNEVDNYTLAKAIENRQYLDKKIAEVTPKQLTRTEKLIQKTDSARKVIGNVSSAAADVAKAWKEVKPVLENLGIIEKNDTVDKIFSKGDSESISAEILNKVKSGKIDKKDLKSYSEAIDALQKIEKAKNGGISNSDKRKKEEADAKKAAEKKAAEKAKEAAEAKEARQKEYEERVARQKVDREAREAASSQRVEELKAEAKRARNVEESRDKQFSSIKNIVDYARSFDVDDVPLSNSPSWYEDLWD